ncbi:cytosolic iron-sulfur assembly component 2B-like [Cynocephalus volans]|uniref:cytosolic iron-sulfur assembly component 2B-like n=1 Tax=Cynocephalus volans TaxID=110931 RepID=UPI002FC8951E
MVGLGSEMVGGGGASVGLLENANPLIYQRSGERPVTAGEEDEEFPDSIDAREIFDLIRSINDPEHPLTLEELNVVEQVQVQVSKPENTVPVVFKPTILHCIHAHHSTLIGLSIRVKLLRSLPQHFKMDVHVTLGTVPWSMYISVGWCEPVNKQLVDKEWVAAALENTPVLEVVNQCLSSRSLAWLLTPSLHTGVLVPAPPRAHSLVFLNR